MARWWLAAGALWMTLPGAASAQDPTPQLYLRGQPVYVRGQVVGEEARVVGREEGDNRFRYSTPALERAIKVAKRVPRGELYRKRLAMYAPGASDSPGVGELPVASSRARARVESSGGQAVADGPGTWRPWLWLAVVTVLGGVGLALARRRRAKLSVRA